MVDFRNEDGRTIIMQAWDGQYDCQALYKVDYYTGTAIQIERGAPSTDGWLTQKGVPIIRLDSVGATVSVNVRAPGSSEWTFFKKFRRDEYAKLDGIDFLGSTSEPGILVVSATLAGEDKKSIQKFDLHDLSFKKRIPGPLNIDIDGCLIDRENRIVATSWTEDRINYKFMDDEISKHYRGINSYFGNECNIYIKDIDVLSSKILVYVSGPRHAGSYWLYDRNRVKLQPLGAAHQGLAQISWAETRVLKFSSRDGQDLTAYLTKPALSEGGALPLIVMPHGGPELRDTYEFNPFVQALCQEGWAVLQVNFRGSGGYGRAFADAGRRRWGDLMQNDVEDALAAVFKNKQVDENKIAICGISYGGYAALMGAVKTPEIYKAVVSIAGVSDLPKMLNFVRLRDGSDSLTYDYWKRTIGDPQNDRKSLEAASPALRAKEIKAPVLLMHGDIDAIVGVEQSRAMRKALLSSNKAVDYVEVSLEGHPNWGAENHLMMVERTIEHIAKAFA